MPLVVAPLDKELIVQRVVADDKVKRHLANLGIIVGSTLCTVGKVNGDMIVKVKSGRVALNKQLAMNIFVR